MAYLFADNPGRWPRADQCYFWKKSIGDHHGRSKRSRQTGTAQRATFWGGRETIFQQARYCSGHQTKGTGQDQPNRERGFYGMQRP